LVDLHLSTEKGTVAPQQKVVERAAAIIQHIFNQHEAPDFAVRLWDGTYAIEPQISPKFTIVINHPGALRRMFLPPSELGIGEAYIYDDFNVEGDIIAAAGTLMEYFQGLNHPFSGAVWMAWQLSRLPHPNKAATYRPALDDRAGEAHSIHRDKQVVQYHYDVSNEFYSLWLDERMVYSCAYFKTGKEDIDQAQFQKLDHICRKLQLKPGERLLDIGCGWGGLTIHAAKHYGVEVVGITLSERQAELARQRIAEAGLEGQCEIRLQDYREVPEDQPFDKLVSVGMFEHVGEDKLPVYFAKAWRLLKPGGLFLNHAIGLMTPHERKINPISKRMFASNGFIDKYVFPDGELVLIPKTLRAAESQGFEVRDVESLREHYALTLRHWVKRLEAKHKEALEYVDEPTYRVWRVYMAGMSHNFGHGRLSLYQSVLYKGMRDGNDNQPWTREHVYGQPLEAD